MKITKLGRLSGLVVAATCCAVYQAPAFYNPESGRWLSRDPIGEKGGISLFVASNNHPNQGLDLLGLRFLWAGPWTYTLANPIPDPNNPDSEFIGSTAWHYFRPKALPYHSKFDCPPCQDKISVSGAAQSVSWWVAFDSQAEAHERAHIEMYKTAALAFSEEAEYHAQRCMPKKQAVCVAAVIMGDMKEAYMLQPHVVGREFDCSVYGQYDPQICERARALELAYVAALEKLMAALHKCEEAQ